MTHSDLFNGHGVFCDNDGTVYDGDWVQGHKSGVASVKYANGDSYLGDYKYGKRHGKGQYTTKDGEIYSGEFVNDMKHGNGHIIKDNTLVKSGITLHFIIGMWIEDEYMKN